MLLEDIDFEVLTATVDDLPAILKLLNNCYLPTAGVQENIHHFLVAHKNGVVGVIGMEQVDDSVLLRSLAVSMDWRKSGIGAALVKRALQYVREGEGKSIYLLTNTAEKYMEHWGFSKIERSQIPAPLLKNSALDNACPSNSTCMKLELSID